MATGDTSQRSLSMAIYTSLLAGALLVTYVAVLGPLDAIFALWALVPGLLVAGGNFLLAGAVGWLLTAGLLPRRAPIVLRLATATALGLWLLGTLVLVLGTLVPSLLAWPWWPVPPVLGAILAGVLARSHLVRWRPPRRVGISALIWLVPAVAGGFWLAGAAMPPGVVNLAGDAYDVMEYHLQLPREWIVDGNISAPRHNAYGFYPFGVQMLYTAAMAGRAGDYGGTYAAKLSHGLFAVLAVAAVAWGLPARERLRGRLAAGLLSAVPFVVYMSWLAMVELAQLAYLVLALLWLREWLDRPDWRTAGILGAMLGAACAVKYLSVGFIVAPVLIGMLLALGRRRSLGSEPSTRATPGGGSATRIGQIVFALAVCLALFSPWLIRNDVYTGNPVFPLATELLGRGHWSEMSQQRWVAGHRPGQHPPVPPPPGYQPPVRPPDRAEQAVEHFLLAPRYNPPLLALALAGVAIAARRGPRRLWNLQLALVLCLQLGLWLLVTRDLPGRFLVPAAAPLALLAGGALASLAGPREIAARSAALARPTLAMACWLAVAATGLALTWQTFQRSGADPGAAGMDPAGASAPSFLRELGAQIDWGQRPGVLLVGEARGWLFPPGAVYATPFDTHPLAAMVREGRTPAEILSRLRQRGVTHIWVRWDEILRLSQTYGYPPELTTEVVRRVRRGLPPGLELFQRMRARGLRVVWDRRRGGLQATLYELPPAE